MLGVLNLERPPLELADVPAGAILWLKVSGSVCAFSLLVWLALRAGRGRAVIPSPVLAVLAAGTVLGYLLLLGFRLPDILDAVSGSTEIKSVGWRAVAADIAFTFGAACALTAALMPFLRNLPHLSGRRIFAMARLSFKEAVRRRILYVCCFLILVLLFVSWFVQSKPESQLQSYVEIVFAVMTLLLLVSAGLVSAFSIPADIKQQTIHTIVTKPVERFEMVLGRFLGYSALMTLVLAIMTTASLFYVLRGVNPEAAQESLKARRPIYGNLVFQRIEGEYTDNPQPPRNVDGTNVGKEWDYHRYIPGFDKRKPRESVMYAVWSFDRIPSRLLNQDTVRCEFAFDIYREHKGKENQGVLCSFFFQTPTFKPNVAVREEYQEARRKQGAGSRLNAEVDNPVSEKYGYYELQGKEVKNFHTYHVDVPAGVFRNAAQAESGPDNPPPLVIRVRCDSPGQMVGMARYNLYLRGDGPNDEVDAVAFAFNFFKCSVGLWMVLVLVVAVSVSVSTELGGIISFLCVMIYLVLGAARGFIQDMTDKALDAAGPVNSAAKLFSRKTLLQPLEDSPFSKVAEGTDEFYRWMMKLFLQVLPDLDRFLFTERTANGFAVGVVGQDLLPGFLLLLGYLVPWAVLSFYLIRSREIAGAN